MVALGVRGTFWKFWEVLVVPGRFSRVPGGAYGDFWKVPYSSTFFWKILFGQSTFH